MDPSHPWPIKTEKSYAVLKLDHLNFRLITTNTVITSWINPGNYLLVTIVHDDQGKICMHEYTLHTRAVLQQGVGAVAAVAPKF